MRIRFGECTFDSEARQLTRSGADVALSPRAFHLLQLLIESRPRAFPQSELKDRLWPGSFVGRTSLAQLVSEVRKAIGDDPAQPRFVRTRHGFGYAFHGEAHAAPDAELEPACRLLWGGREIPLGPGEHLIGRAPDCAVRLDTPKASRHHARIVVSGGYAVLEDLGSKHGTHLGVRRIDGAVKLADGDEICIGAAVLIFLRASGTGFTETA